MKKIECLARSVGRRVLLSSPHAIAVNLSKRLGLEKNINYIGVLLLTLAVVFLLTLLPQFLFGRPPFLPVQYLYLLFPLSLVGMFYTIWICSRFFEAFGAEGTNWHRPFDFQYWFLVFPIILIILALLLSFLGVVGYRPYHDWCSLNQVTILLFLCASLSFYFLFLRFFYAAKYIESKIGFLLHINNVASILYLASFVILFFWILLAFSVSEFVGGALAYYEINPPH